MHQLPIIYITSPWITSHCRQSLCTRLLYTLLPSPYTNENLRAVLEEMVKDINLLNTDGITVARSNPKKSFHQLKTLVAYRYRVLGPVQDVCHLKLAQVEWQNKKYTYFFTYCGAKGDWPFLRSALGLNCGYNCLRKCHRCDIADTWLNQFCPQNLSFPISKVPPSLRNIAFVNPSCPVVRR